MNVGFKQTSSPSLAIDGIQSKKTFCFNRQKKEALLTPTPKVAEKHKWFSWWHRPKKNQSEDNNSDSLTLSNRENTDPINNQNSSFKRNWFSCWHRPKKNQTEDNNNNDSLILDYQTDIQENTNNSTYLDSPIQISLPAINNTHRSQEINLYQNMSPVSDSSINIFSEHNATSDYSDSDDNLDEMETAKTIQIQQGKAELVDLNDSNSSSIISEHNSTSDYSDTDDDLDKMETAKIVYEPTYKAELVYLNKSNSPSILSEKDSTSDLDSDDDLDKMETAKIIQIQQGKAELVYINDSGNEIPATNLDLDLYKSDDVNNIYYGVTRSEQMKQRKQELDSYRKSLKNLGIMSVKERADLINHNQRLKLINKYNTY